MVCVHDSCQYIFVYFYYVFHPECSPKEPHVQVVHVIGHLVHNMEIPWKL
jgi:hypothetical protein